MVLYMRSLSIVSRLTVTFTNEMRYMSFAGLTDIDQDFGGKCEFVVHAKLCFRENGLC